MSETHRVCCSEAVSIVHEQLDFIIKSTEKSVENASDSKTRAKVKGILHQIKSFDFITALQIMHPILQIIIKVSKTLQSLDIDLC